MLTIRKHELLRELEQWPDDTPIYVWSNDGRQALRARLLVGAEPNGQHYVVMEVDDD